MKAPAVQGVEKLLTMNDVAMLIDRPVRFVREKLIRTGVLPHVMFGGNSVRIRPADYSKMIEKGATGFGSAKPSSRFRG